jgi:hypothetical protein
MPQKNNIKYQNTLPGFNSAEKLHCSLHSWLLFMTKQQKLYYAASKSDITIISNRWVAHGTLQDEGHMHMIVNCSITSTTKLLITQILYYHSNSKTC